MEYVEKIGEFNSNHKIYTIIEEAINNLDNPYIVEHFEEYDMQNRDDIKYSINFELDRKNTKIEKFSNGVISAKIMILLRDIEIKIVHEDNFEDEDYDEDLYTDIFSGKYDDVPEWVWDDLRDNMWDEINNFLPSLEITFIKFLQDGNIK